ncbi:hypothetical protein IMZ48_14810, partial [Candidatus Bathyarchaeota archaeon]|nr:hypothetical protein [Candidatus Bathyarchaeota archaeon]
LFAAGAFEGGFFENGFGCEVGAVEDAAANGLRTAAPPLLWGAVAGGCAPNGLDADGWGFGFDAKGLDAKGDAEGVCDAGGQPLPPKEDIVFAGEDGHLGRWCDSGRDN